jgi:3-hydroxyisobutyrate dehydrogenase
MKRTRLSTAPPDVTATIGFIGLGHMGGAMAARLLAAGYTVYGTSRTRERAHALLVDGLRWRETPREIAQATDIIVTSLPDDGVVDTVTTGPDGILAGLAAGQTWLDTSTVSPQESRRRAELVRDLGANLLDAPVSGSVPQARAGTLAIMVGGDPDTYTRVEPVLRELGTPTHIGPNGQGLALKLAININLAVQMLAFSEGLLLAARSGVDPRVALEVMTSTAIGSPMLKIRAPIVLDPPAEAWFTLELMQKDVGLARDVARSLDIPLPTAERIDEVLTRARALGYEQRDLAALFEVLEQMTADRRQSV